MVLRFLPLLRVLPGTMRVCLVGEVGLEVCAGKGTTAKEAMKTGLWQPCDPVAGAITINIGDALQYWSDDRLKSTFHRVRVPKEHEYKVCCCWAVASVSYRIQQIIMAGR